jgi:hypothetical protein
LSSQAKDAKYWSDPELVIATERYNMGWRRRFIDLDRRTQALRVERSEAAAISNIS